MRKYRNETVEKLELLSCNRCGKSIKLVNGMEAEGYAMLKCRGDTFQKWTEKFTASTCARNVTAN